MVSMNDPRNGKVWMVDVVGGAVLAAALAGAAWSLLIDGAAISQQRESTVAALTETNRALKALQTGMERVRTELSTRQSELAATPPLPREPRVEEYFAAVSAAAGRHGLRLVRHQPLPFRVYPGLSEQRYALEVVGASPDLAAFLVEVEESGFAADVSYLQIQAASGSAGSGEGERVATLTFSVFAATEGKGG